MGTSERWPPPTIHAWCNGERLDASALIHDLEYSLMVLTGHRWEQGRVLYPGDLDAIDAADQGGDLRSMSHLEADLARLIRRIGGQSLENLRISGDVLRLGTEMLSELRRLRQLAIDLGSTPDPIEAKP